MEAADLKQAATDAAGQTRSFISAQLDDRSTQLGNSISSTAADLRRIADNLRDNETVAGSADLAQFGADYIDKIGSYLRDSDGEQLIADAEDFARQRPWAVAAAAVAVGFAASRVLKASSSRRYRSTYGSSGYGSSTSFGSNSRNGSTAGYGANADSTSYAD